jgi:hypothetical protein
MITEVSVLAAVGQHVKTIAVAQPDVGQDDVVAFAVDGGQRIAATGGGIQLIALLPEPVGHGLEYLAIVIHQQHRGGLHIQDPDRIRRGQGGRCACARRYSPQCDCSGNWLGGSVCVVKMGK